MRFKDFISMTLEEHLLHVLTFGTFAGAIALVALDGGFQSLLAIVGHIF